MRRPALFTRFAGSRVGGTLVLAFWGGLFLDWYVLNGPVPWWLAIGSLGGIIRTLRARTTMRQYNQWAAAWNAMGSPEDERVPPARGRVKRLAFEALIIFTFLVPFIVPHFRVNDPQLMPLTVLWGAALLYVASRIGRAALERRHRRQAKQLDAEALAPACVVLKRPGHSPSRQAAQKALPEYCARLLKAG